MQEKYRTFWPRLLAGIIDTLVFFPFIFPELFWDMTSVRTIITLDIIYLVLYTLYVIIGHGVYGHTLGKKVMRIKLLDLSERSTIGILRAFLRESVWVVLSIAMVIELAIRTNGRDFISVEESEQISVSLWISFGWLLIEIITMLSNSKRRALHDYIAKSVVIRIKKEKS